MKRLIHSHSGYSRIEIAFMATLAALVSILAITKYLDLSEMTEDSMEPGVVVAIKQSLANYAEESRDIGRNPLYPKSLDQAKIGDTGIRNPFFSHVLEGGIAVAGWSKTGNNAYAAPSGTNYAYYPDTGKFQSIDAPTPVTGTPSPEPDAN